VRRRINPLTPSVFVGLLVLPALAFSGRSGEGNPAGSAAPVGKPSILLILSDDQRFDLLEQMPIVRRRIVDRGVTFSNSFVVTPLCCPSRVSTLRGQYAHTTGLYQVGGPFGGYRTVHADGLEDDTMATWLREAGYRTGLFGKYLNGYNKLTVVPPGWDAWYAIDNGGTTNMYFDYWQSVNGTPVWHGSRPQDYSTDVIAQQAVDFIRDADPGVPLFLHVDPRAPHAPTLPAPRYRGTRCPIRAFAIPPSSHEANVSDKPAYVRSADAEGDAAAMREKQCLALRATDDAVGLILRALAATGRLSNTLIVVTSDNGLMNTEHRLNGKKVPYESSIRVPLAIRYDPAGTAGTVDRHLVTNLDHAATFLELAGATATVPLDGRSLVPLIHGRSPAWRSGFLIEGYDDPAAPHGGRYVPTYCGVRTIDEKFVEYATGEAEYYDLRRDPYELVNRASAPAKALRVAALRARLGRLCSPRPPGMPSI
jgi:arylsulfatase A-like enzyme